VDLAKDHPILDPHHRATISQQSVSKPPFNDDLSSDPMGIINLSKWISKMKMQDTCQKEKDAFNVETLLLCIHGTSIYKNCQINFAEAQGGRVQG
jgi:hypothetical protein